MVDASKGIGCILRCKVNITTIYHYHESPINRIKTRYCG